MHLAIVISSLAGGGAERAISEMAHYWVARSWSITVITWSGDADQDAYGLDSRVARVRLGVDAPSSGWALKLTGNWRRIALLRAAIRRAAPDAVLSFMDSTNVTTLLATRASGIPVIVAERSDPQANTTLPSAWRRLRRWTYRLADRVVAQTRPAAQWLHAQCRTEVTVIPNLLRRLPPAGPATLREKCVLFVGRLSAEKDAATLLRAFALATERERDWRLVMVGDGPLRGELTELSRSLGISDRVQFVGFDPHPEAWMARAGIFVLSSVFEGFPNALLEAMALETAVISSDCPSGPREIVREGVNGRLFQVGDAQGLAALLQELMSDEAQRARLGQAAGQVRSQFSPERIMPQWEQLIRAAGARGS